MPSLAGGFLDSRIFRFIRFLIPQQDSDGSWVRPSWARFVGWSGASGGVLLVSLESQEARGTLKKNTIDAWGREKLEHRFEVCICCLRPCPLSDVQAYSKPSHHQGWSFKPLVCSHASTTNLNNLLFFVGGGGQGLNPQLEHPSVFDFLGPWSGCITFCPMNRSPAGDLRDQPPDRGLAVGARLSREVARALRGARGRSFGP